MIKKLVLILMAILVVSCKQVSTDEAGKWVKNDGDYDIYITKPEELVSLKMKKGTEVKVRYYRNPAINFVGAPEVWVNEGADFSETDNFIKATADKDYITLKLTDAVTIGALAGEVGVGAVIIGMVDSKGEQYESNLLLVVAQ